MRRNANRIQSDRTDHRYFVMLPHIVLAKCRDPYDLALWVAVKTVAGDEGACSLGTRELAKLAGMSLGKVVQSRQHLLDEGLLIGGIVRPPGYDQDVYVLQIPDLWPENTAWRSAQPAGLRERIEAIHQQRATLKNHSTGVHHMNTCQEGERAPHEQGCSPHEHLEGEGCSPGELIKEHNIREPEREPLWEVVRSHLRLQLPQNTYDTWLRDAVALRAGTHLLVVQCTNEYQAQWLRLRLDNLIQKTVAAVFEAEIAVTYTVQPPARAREEAAA